MLKKNSRSFFPVRGRAPKPCAFRGRTRAREGPQDKTGSSPTADGCRAITADGCRRPRDHEDRRGRRERNRETRGKTRGIEESPRRWRSTDRWSYAGGQCSEQMHGPDLQRSRWEASWSAEKNMVAPKADRASWSSRIHYIRTGPVTTSIGRSLVVPDFTPQW